MNRDVIKVVYVTSSARSGSTLLDLILGSGPSAVSGGELRRTVPVGCQENGICTCRVLFDECPFWQEVMGTWKSNSDVDPMDFFSSQRAITRSRRAWRLYAGLGLGGGQRAQGWMNSLVGFYRAFTQVSGTDCIIDSSKSPMYALALEACPGIDLRLVHLVRDPRGVAWSLGREQPTNAAEGVPSYVKSQPVRRSAIEWRLANNLSHRLARRLPASRCCMVRYEDIVDDWTAASQRIAECCGIPVPGDLDVLQPAGSIPPRHMLAGNRLRLVDCITVKSDESWKKDMPDDWRGTVERFCGKQMKGYGYSSR